MVTVLKLVLFGVPGFLSVRYPMLQVGTEERGDATGSLPGI